VQGKRAIEDYNEAIRLKPDYADAYISSGLCIYGRARKILAAVMRKKRVHWETANC
jgi:hypothetical protein